MQKLAWVLAPVVFLAFFGVYSYRLGVQPALMHDDFEYTYPSFDLAERGRFGSPLLGPGLNIENRTYNLIVYYYASVHAVLIRLFGDGPQSVPLANSFHFAVLAAAGAFFLVRREALLGAGVFLLALASDARLIDAARHGRPEMTAGCCLTLAVGALWLRLGERRHRPLVLFAMSAALSAGLLSHTAVVFFALALGASFALPLLRHAGLREVLAGLAPFLVIPLLFGYFILTDDIEHLQGQLAPARGDVAVGRVLLPLVQGDWGGFSILAAEFVRTHAGPPLLWLGVLGALAITFVVEHPLARGARFFAATYCLLFATHFLFLKHFVLSYRVIYQPVLYLALALLAEALLVGFASRLGRPGWLRPLRLAGFAALLAASALCMSRFREGLLGQPLPFARLKGALTYALLESGARAGDRIVVPSPFGFHLRRTFDVVAYPAPKYSKGRWRAAFRDGVRAVWGKETLARVSGPALCDAMWLAFVRPAWVLAWDADYSVVLPFYELLRRYPDIPGMEVERGRRAVLPAPYHGTVRAYRLRYLPAVDALDRTLQSAATSCP